MVFFCSEGLQLECELWLSLVNTSEIAPTIRIERGNGGLVRGGQPLIALTIPLRGSFNYLCICYLRKAAEFVHTFCYANVEVAIMLLQIGLHDLAHGGMVITSSQKVCKYERPVFIILLRISLEFFLHTRYTVSAKAVTGDYTDHPKEHRKLRQRTSKLPHICVGIDLGAHASRLHSRVILRMQAIFDIVRSDRI